jgi:hypothetical protein
MKVKISTILIVVGIFLMVVSFVAPSTFAIVSAEPNGNSGYVSLSSTTPSSTVSTSPTLLPYSSSGSESIGATWLISNSYTSSTGLVGGSTSQSVSFTSSTNQLDYGLVGNSLTASTGTLTTDISATAVPISSGYAITIHGYVYLTKSVSMTVNDNYAFYFNFTGTFSVAGTTYNVYGGTSLMYGEMQNTLLNNGHFYMYVNGAYTEITPSSQISLLPSTFPYTIPVWYVYDNGTPQNQGTVYVQVNGGSHIDFNLNATAQTINGYKAWEINVTISSQGTYTINGYATDSITGSPIQLMSIGVAGSNGASVSTTINWGLFEIGIIITVIGLIVWRFIRI